MQENHEESVVTEASSAPTANPPSGPKKAIIGIVVLALALGAVYKGYAAYSFGKSHVETDNAYVTGDLVGISPTVSGTLVELNVQDGDFVKKGQLIARLGTEGPAAELAQAEASYQAALTQVPQAQAALTFERLNNAASIQRSQAALAAQQSRTAGSQLQIRLSADTVANQVKQAESSIASARAQAAQARAVAAQAQAGIETAKAAVVSAESAVETALRNADSQRALVDAARADDERAASDLARYRKLLATEAISRQQFDTAQAAATSAHANLTSAQERARGAVSAVEQARAGVAQARAALVAAQRQRDAAVKQAEAADKQVDVAIAGRDLAQAGNTQVGIQGANAQSAQDQTGQASADVAAAQAGTQQITLREKQVTAAQAQVELARAAVERARVRVRDANLYAPCDGYVVKHTVNVGTAVNPGQTIVTITRGSDIWVMANFKETQLENVREGQGAEVAVDAFPGKTFHGRVLSIIRATGSATTLLPPDNSTGNFTKVVQRVPVKISIEPGEGVDRIRQGMSVIATINTSKGGE